MLEIVVVAIALVNLITFVVYGIDKLKAKKSRWRIPESTLLALAFCGGSLGALLGMQIWRHKTKHRKFQFFVPLFLIMHCTLAVCVLRNFDF